MMFRSEPVAIPGAAATIHREAPSWDGLRTAAVGGFSCKSAARGQELLDRTAALLGEEGYRALIGPMDGDTWHRYRLVMASDGSPPFALEPVSGPHDLEAFQAAGFKAISNYASSYGRLDEAIGEDAVELPDISVASWDGRDTEGLVDRLFAMSAARFAGNHFYKAIDRAAFLKLYQPVLPLIDPRLVLFAQGADGQPVGFLFGLPDRLESAEPSTVILKTYASGQRGVGRLLADSFHRQALALGYRFVIHALMHSQNVSLERSERYGTRVFRRYALMGRRL